MASSATPPHDLLIELANAHTHAFNGTLIKFQLRMRIFQKMNVPYLSA